MTDLNKLIELRNAVGEWIRLDDLATDAALNMDHREETGLAFDAATIASHAQQEIVRRIYSEITEV